ncbi:MAG TPA: succinate dehydrogenase assembly factor 2 [Stellaceae bacterium]|nr:succinate dehydrogenase assembly factor 2 [Stellaceae bacterium]
MEEPPDIRLKRLLFRSWHRGMREADLLLGPFAERHLPSLSPRELDLFEALLAERDDDIVSWISGLAAPPAAQDTSLLRRLMDFRAGPRPG